jgi:hypothetical protein
VKYTNKYGLPEAFVRAVMNDPYTRGESDFSPSSLDTTPKAFALLKAFPDQAEVDVSSRVDAIIGQGAHVIAERAARPGVDLCEVRLFGDFVVDGKKYVVSAQLDLYETDTGHFMDWKTAKAQAFGKKNGGGKKASWIAQTNIGAELLRRQGHSPKRLTIIGLLKDWVKFQAGTDKCPASQVVAVDLPVWTSEQVNEYIEARIRALVGATPETICEPKDNWYGRRCGQWCDAASVCQQYQESLKTGILNRKAGGE